MGQAGAEAGLDQSEDWGPRQCVLGLCLGEEVSGKFGCAWAAPRSLQVCTGWSEGPWKSEMTPSSVAH